MGLRTPNDKLKMCKVIGTSLLCTSSFLKLEPCDEDYIQFSALCFPKAVISEYEQALSHTCSFQDSQKMNSHIEMEKEGISFKKLA